MSKKITKEQTAYTYTQGKRVYSGELSLPEAKKIVIQFTDMNEGSANGYISTFLKLMEGEEYKWTINAYSTDYFLRNIEQDYGVEYLKTALNAVRKHLENNSNPLKNIYQIYQTHINNIKTSTIEEFYSSFEKNVSLSHSNSQETRLSRLKVAAKTPKETIVTAKVFVRNPDVVAETLARAKGICERCNNRAPFIRARDNTPYLEVHHKINLANSGDDTIENTLALCPNCHRELHFGTKEQE